MQPSTLSSAMTVTMKGWFAHYPNCPDDLFGLWWKMITDGVRHEMKSTDSGGPLLVCLFVEQAP